MEESSEQSLELRRKLEIVVEAGLRLSKNLDLQTIVQATTDAGLTLCGAQFGAFFYNVTDAVGESYVLYTLSGVDREKFSKFPMPRNTAIFGPTFEGTAVVRSGDITKDPRYGHSAPYFGMPKGHLPVCSYLAIPVKSQSGEVLGGLFYGHSDKDVFKQEAEDLVGTVAAQAAIAIENARLRDELQHKIGELDKAEMVRQETAKRLAELAAIVESSDDAIISKDLTGRIMTWNSAAARIFGYTPEEIVGQSILILLPEDLRSEETTILQKIRSGQRIDHYETIRLTKGRERLDVSLSISPIRDASGTIVGASKILRNISEEKRMRASLIQAEKIAAAGRMAATIAHEINNPLEAVVNLLFLARAGATDLEQIGYLTSAENEVARVSHIAKQTLGFYREHASEVSVSLSELVADALNIYSGKCRAAGIVINGNLRSSRPIMLRHGEMMQVISNLIANAIYAMPDGGTLTISVEDTGEPSEGVLVTCEDTGVGIGAEQLPKIFDAFFTTRGAIGTGIGLFVTKQFVEGHRGTISVESSTDAASHGTRMSVFLPVKNPYSEVVKS